MKFASIALAAGIFVAGAIPAFAQVPPPPAVTAASASPTSAAIGTSVTFTGSATGVGLTYQWNFGDGTFTAFTVSATTTHTYSTPGHFTVTLTVQDFAAQQASSSFIFVAHRALLSPAPSNSSPIILDAANRLVWCVNQDSDTVTAINADTRVKVREVAVGREPRSLAKAGDGNIWVVSQDHPSISIVDPTTGILEHVIPLPHGSAPFGIAISPDGLYAFVSFQGAGGVKKISVTTRAVLATATVPPKARGISVTADGRVFVGRFVSPVSSGEVVELAASTLAVTRTFSLALDPGDTIGGPDTSIAGRGVPNYITGIGVSPDGRRLWVPSKKDNTVRGTSAVNDGQLLDFEKTVRTIASSIDLSANGELLSERLDFDNADLAQSVAFSPRGDLMFVGLQGVNRIQVRDLFDDSGNPPATQVSYLAQYAQITTQALYDPGTGDPNPPPAVQDGLSPVGLVIDSVTNHLFVLCYMSRTVKVFDVSTILGFTGTTATLAATVSNVTTELLSATVLRGKQIFYNAGDRRMSRDNYLACATCHLDGGSDQRIWDFTQRGEGLRNTTMLQGRGGMTMGFVHWSANFDEIQDFENDVRNGFGGRGFLTDANFAATTATYTGTRKVGLSGELDALAAYVVSLTKVKRSPFRNSDGTLTAAGARGETVFRAQNCASCHTGRGFNNSDLPPGALPNPAPPLLNNVGTLTANSGQRLGAALTGIDTPTLKGLWETGPYLHDGSASTVAAVVARVPNANTHGGMHLLSAADQADLTQYMIEIDEVDAPPLGTGAPTPTVTIASVSTSRPYSLATSAAGGLAYVDRRYTVAALSAALQNRVFVRTSNDDRNVSTATHLTLTLVNTATVYVGYDPRATSRPAWLDGTWVASAETITLGNPGALALTVLEKAFPAGSVVLGGNLATGAAGALRNYVVIVRETPGPAVFEEGPISQTEYVHDQDADGDGLRDDYEAVAAAATSNPSPFNADTDADATPDEEETATGGTHFEAEQAYYIALALVVSVGGSDSSSSCGLMGVEMLALLGLLLLRRRRA